MLDTNSLQKTHLNKKNKKTVYNFKYKVIILGDRGVGKSTLIQLSTDRDSQSSFFLDPHIYYGVKKIDNKLIEIWNFEENLLEIEKKEYYSDADAAVIVFDVNKSDTFEYAKQLFEELIHYSDRMLPVFLIGNKRNLCEFNVSTVSKETVLEYLYSLGNCLLHKIPYIELSFLFRNDMNKIFRNLITMIECNKTDKCLSTPVQLRNWCELRQFYSMNELIGNS